MLLAGTGLPVPHRREDPVRGGDRAHGPVGAAGPPMDGEGWVRNLLVVFGHRTRLGWSGSDR